MAHIRQDALPLAGMTLLLIEDDDAVRNMLRRLLERAGADVTAVDTACLPAPATAARFNAAVCVWTAATANLLRRCPHLPVVLLDDPVGPTPPAAVRMAKLDVHRELVPAIVDLGARAPHQ